jgi:hypothetical protein
MNFKLEKLLYFDVETVAKYKSLTDMPSDERKIWDSYLTTFEKRVTDDTKLVGLEPTSIEYLNEVYKQTAGLYPEFGKVCCVSLGFVTKKGEAKLESHCGEDEVTILRDVRTVFNKVSTMDFILCGQNIKKFDIPFLGKRFFINGLKPPKMFPEHDTKPWDIKLVDTKDVWSFGGYGLSSLDLITTMLGVDSPKNGDVRGDNVNDFYWKGEHELIGEYCEKDVKALIDITQKLNSLE